MFSSAFQLIFEMRVDAPQVYRVVEWLRSGREEQQYQAVLALRSLAAEPDNKDLIREAGGVQELIKLLDFGPNASLTIVAAETISCLVADDQVNRVESCSILFISKFNSRSFCDIMEVLRSW